MAGKLSSVTRDNPLRVSDPGGGGTTPWFDFDLGMAGIFMPGVQTAELYAEVARIQVAIRNSIATGTVRSNGKVHSGY